MPAADPAQRLDQENHVLRELALDLADGARSLVQEIQLRAKRANTDADFRRLVELYNETSQSARRAALLLLRVRRPDPQPRTPLDATHQDTTPHDATPPAGPDPAPSPEPTDRPDPPERFESGDSPETLGDDQRAISRNPSKAFGAIVADLRRIREELGTRAPPGTDRRLRTLERAVAETRHPQPDDRRQTAEQRRARKTRPPPGFG